MAVLHQWSNCVSSTFFCFLNTVSSCIWRLVAGSIITRIDSVALEIRDLKVDTAKLYYVSDSNHLLLIVRKEVFQYLINGSFFANDKPHRSAQVDVILFVFISFALGFCFFVNLLNSPNATFSWTLAEVVLMQERFIVGPQAPVLVLHKESQHYLVFPLQL